ncbi:hypothetical protein ACF0H5_017626 [Mactra antiquata]
MRSSDHLRHTLTILLLTLQVSSFINPTLSQTLGLETCRPQADVIFLLDGSDSISDQEFLEQKQFVRRFIELSDVGPDAIRVGLAVVSSKIGDELPLSLNATKAGLLTMLKTISQPQEGSRTDLGLIEMEQLFSTNSRRGVARIGVVITDGRAKYIKATEGEARVVKDAGIFLIAVGVGRLIKFSELEKIASTKSNAYNLDPLDLSTRYLAETVDFQGLESCTGNMLIDKLGIIDQKSAPIAGKNPMSTTDTKVNTAVAPGLAGDVMENTNFDLSAFNINNFPDPSVAQLNVENISASSPNKVLGLSTSEFNNVADQSVSLTQNTNPLSIGLPNSAMDLSAAVMSNMAALSAALSNDSTNQMGVLPNNMADLLKNLPVAMQPKTTPIPVKEPVIVPDVVKTTQSTAPMNHMRPGNNGMPELINFMGLQMKPFAGMGRFSAINPLSMGNQPHPPQPPPTTVPPTAPPTQPAFVMTTYKPVAAPSTTQKPATIAPQVVATTQIPPDKLFNSLVQYNNDGSSPTETSNLMIKNWMSSIIGNAMPSDSTRSIDTGPQLFDTSGVAAHGDRNGVGIQIPGTSVADSLAFLKAGMKPARTVEEITNPIYQMFDASHGSQTKRTTQSIVTTTVSPEETYKQRTILLLKEQCSKGTFVNGIAYIAKPGSCTEFLKCYQRLGDMQFDVVKCPFETFYDDQQFVCRHNTEQMCWNDPCADQNLASYSHEGNCRAHWSCNRGKSVPTCCPLGTSYIQGFGCGRNVTCTDTCMDFGDLRTRTMNSHCKLLGIEGDTTGYFEHVAGMGWVLRACARGSNFDPSHCSCTSQQHAAVETCTPELYLDFQGGIIDKSKNSLAMGIQNVDLDGGTGAFYGRSHLKLWRFSGMSLGQHVTISFRFRTSVMAQKGKLMHIVSNCCYGCTSEPKPSIDIALIPADQGGIAVFSTTTTEAGEMFLFVPFKDTFTGWNTLEYSYDGLQMKGTVNGKSAMKKMLGSIEAKSDPLLIGSCGIENAYDGFLDEFKFYMCNP